MTLIYCPKCGDVRKLDFRVTTCKCGASKGWNVLDELNAVIQGAAIPIGFTNDSFSNALRKRRPNGLGKLFNAFVIPKDCPTVTKLDAKS